MKPSLLHQKKDQGNILVKVLIGFFLLIILFILQDIFLAPDNKKFTKQMFRNNPLNKISNKSPYSASNFDWSEGTCKGKKGTVPLTALPMKPQDIGVIYPYGTMDTQSGHVTPIDHQYYYPINLHSAPDAYPVYAPADGYLIAIGRRNQFVGEEERKLPVPDYQLVFEHTCSFWSYMDLVTSLSREIAIEAKELSETEIFDQINVRIPVKAGQEIGRIGGRTLDFGVYDGQTTLPGFLVLEHYDGEAWKVHTVDPYDFFVEPIRSQLIAKTARSQAPIGGKLDYDIDGKLQGNWFVVGSGGFPAEYQDKNWRNHLSIVPDAFDPTFFIFSSGNINGTPKAYGIKDSSPTPNQAGISDRLIKYELIDWDYLSEGRPWDRLSLARNIKAKPGVGVRGVVLLQLVSSRQLKVEVFIGKTVAEVSNFTSQVVTYER